MRRFPACRVNDSSFICRWGLFRPDWKAVPATGKKDANGSCARDEEAEFRETATKKNESKNET